jgi:hypothetical protein
MVENTFAQSTGKIEDGINAAISQNNLINIDGFKIIGLNLTVTEKPDLIFHNATTKPAHAANTFLAENKETTFSTIQTIGVRGSVYPFSAKNYTFPFPGPVEMKYDEIYLKNKVILLLSDYTVNTVFYMGQQSSNLWTKINNDTEGLPFAIDTKGLGLIVPELSAFFNKQVYNCTLKVGIMGMHKQPILTTHEDGSEVYLNFGMFIDVHNETSVYDDAFNAVNFNFEYIIRLKAFTVNDKLNVNINSVTGTTVTADSHIGPINTEAVRKTVESLAKVAVTQKAALLKNIDLAEMLKNKTGVTFHNIILDSNTGHNAITLNYDD